MRRRAGLLIAIPALTGLALLACGEFTPTAEESARSDAGADVGADGNAPGDALVEAAPDDADAAALRFCQKNTGPTTRLCADFDEVGRPVEDYFGKKVGMVAKDMTAFSPPASMRAVRSTDSYLEKAFSDPAAEWTIAFSVRPDPAPSTPAPYARPMEFANVAGSACTIEMELLADGTTQLRLSNPVDGGAAARKVSFDRNVVRGQWNRVEIVITTSASSVSVRANVDGMPATMGSQDTGCSPPAVRPTLRLGAFGAAGYASNFDDVLVNGAP